MLLERIHFPSWLKPASAACFLLLIMYSPAAAADAAFQALRSWALSVAPSLLPFLIAVPALTSEETCRLLEKVSKRLLHALRLPKNCCGALLIGLLSGSPAGAAALSAIRREKDDPNGCFVRAALLSSGASCAFLLSGISVGMLNAPETGFILLRSQLAAVFVCALLLRKIGSDRLSSACIGTAQTQSPILSAMLTLLNIGGYMTFFAVLTRQLSLLLRAAAELPLRCVMELSLGCQSLAELNVPLDAKLPLISAVSCFGGISVYIQSMSYLKPIGIHPAEYAAGKLIQAALAAMFTHLQLRYLPVDFSAAYSYLLQLDLPMLSVLTVSIIILLLIFCTAFYGKSAHHQKTQPPDS